MKFHKKRAMVDDTRAFEVPLELDPSRLSSSIFKLESHKISRMLAKGWARSLRLLTFDDGPLEAGSAKQQCARCDLTMGMPLDGHHCGSHRGPLRGLVVKPAENLNACKHVASVTCSYCQHIPLFPSQGTVTRFRIRRIIPKTQPRIADDLENYDLKNHEEFPCCHFVAVSYCWSITTKQKSQKRYTVVEEDGSTREARTSKEILDRAVAFARENGYRMIWVDQECIQQDNEHEKEIGIQAMDFVYSCANVTIALFTAELDQRHFDNLLGFDENAVAKGANLSLKGSKRHRTKGRNVIVEAILLEAFIAVVNDRWNSRAWVLQEAFAATGNTLILLPRLKSIDVRHLRLVCHAKSLTEVCLDHRVLHICLKFASNIARMSPQREDVKLAMDKAEFFQPFAPKPTVLEISIGGARARDACNAAVALSFLRDRDNSIVADRVAIIANLCDYQVRLNTHSLQKSQPSLALCVLALALMNGDLSLFTPEIFRDPHRSEWAISSFQDLLLSSLDAMPSISSTTMKARGVSFGPVAPESYALCDSGLRLAGFLWKPKELIRLRSIQEAYSESWFALNEERQSLINRYFRGPDNFRTNMSWDVARLNHAKRRERAITQVLLELLLLLRKRGEIRVADAIWQSTCDPTWSNKKGYEPHQSVTEIPDDASVGNRKSMFRLQQVDFLTYHPEWLIDQVMKIGGVWTVELVRCARDAEYSEQLPAAGTTEADISNLMHDLFDESHRDVNDRSPRMSTDTNDILVSKRNQVQEAVPDDMGKGPWENPFQAPAVAELLRQIMEIFTTTMMFYPETPTQSTKVSDACLFQSGLYGSSISLGWLHRENLLRGRIAIFDLGDHQVDQTMILTPFQLPLETNSPEMLRHLSMSWAVRQANETSKHSKYETFHMKGVVKGMWPITPVPGGRYKLL